MAEGKPVVRVVGTAVVVMPWSDAGAGAAGAGAGSVGGRCWILAARRVRLEPCRRACWH